LNTPLNYTANIPTETASNDFEALYLAVRKYEGRVYTDEEVSQLPDISPSHKYYNEWQLRKRSAGRLMAYLAKKDTPLKILEIGCGNGWLSAKLAEIPGAQVTGLDINLTEINQARRVFNKEGLRFVNGIIDSDELLSERFDVIVFAAVLPYFSSVADTLQMALDKLYSRGEVHIIDTNFYTPNNADNAIQRCRVYYDAMNFPAMASRYFHHQLKELDGFKYEVLINPASIFNRISKKEPFYWISITK
jgi:2-polyprenyl-3-methyl-5-hydroxy-6-metoxy-1,4-benzoquinol methylase